MNAEAPDRDAYARDLWPRGLVCLQEGREPKERPAAVVWPETVEDMVRLTALARRSGPSLALFGAGSGVCGAIAPDLETVVGALNIRRRLSRARRRARVRGTRAPRDKGGGEVLEKTLERVKQRLRRLGPSKRPT